MKTTCLMLYAKVVCGTKKTILVPVFVPQTRKVDPGLAVGTLIAMGKLNVLDVRPPDGTAQKISSNC